MLLFEKATGLTKIRMLERHDAAGIALLEARAAFKVASRYGDDISMVTRVTEFRRSTFLVHHRVMKGDTLALEGFETRVWTVRDPGDGNRLRAGTIPPGVIGAFGG